MSDLILDIFEVLTGLHPSPMKDPSRDQTSTPPSEQEEVAND